MESGQIRRPSEAVLAALPDPVVVVEGGAVAWHNAAARELFGLPAAGLDGREWSAVLGPEHEEALLDAQDRARGADEAVRLSLRRRDAVGVDLSLDVAVIADGPGSCTCCATRRRPRRRAPGLLAEKRRTDAHPGRHRRGHLHRPLPARRQRGVRARRARLGAPARQPAGGPDLRRGLGRRDPSGRRRALRRGRRPAAAGRADRVRAAARLLRRRHAHDPRPRAPDPPLGRLRGRQRRALGHHRPQGDGGAACARPWRWPRPRCARRRAPAPSPSG